MRKRNYLKTERRASNSRRKTALLVAAVVLGGYFLVSLVLGEMGLIKYVRMKARYDTLTDEIATLKGDNAALFDEVRALKSDPDRLERLARDKLGLARPGEIVYYYGEP
jgi:cell division protein FtsB